MELVTPPDDSCIANSVTRQTILDMKDRIEKGFNMKVVERQISIHEVLNAHKEGRLFEMFGAGSHCDLLPIDRVVYDMSQITIEQGAFCRDLNQILRDAARAPAYQNKWATPFE